MLWRQAPGPGLVSRSETAPRRGTARARGGRHRRGDADAQQPQADAYLDLGEVLALADRPREAADALEQALARYDRKENLVMAARTRTRLAELELGASR